MNALATLRAVSVAEGISLLTLLVIAMPLKYVYGLPMAVRIVGGVHGLLFLALASALWRAQAELSWPARRAFTLLALAVLPLGFLPIERALKRESARGRR